MNGSNSQQQRAQRGVAAVVAIAIAGGSAYFLWRNSRTLEQRKYSKHTKRFNGMGCGASTSQVRPAPAPENGAPIEPPTRAPSAPDTFMTNNLGFRIPVRIKENGEGKHSESIVSESQNEITSQHELDNFRIKEAQEEVKRVSCWLKIFGQSYLGSIEVDWGSIADLSSPENIIKALDQANRGGSGSGKTGTVSLSEARCLGLPRRARGEIWAALLQVESLKACYAEDFYTSFAKNEVQRFPLRLSECSDLERQILLDVKRTFSDNVYFCSRFGRMALYRILKRLACEFGEVGYVQGHNFLAGLCLLTMLCQYCPQYLESGDDSDSSQDFIEDELFGTVNRNVADNSQEVTDLHMRAEQEAFWVSLALLRGNPNRPLEEKGSKSEKVEVSSHYKDRLISFFAPGLARLQSSATSLDGCISKTYPAVHDNMKEVGVEPLFYCCPYFLTLFTYNLPTAITLQIWDSFLLSHLIPPNSNDASGACGVERVTASSFERFVISIVLAYTGEWKELILNAQSSEQVLLLFRYLRLREAAPCANILMQAQKLSDHVKSILEGTHEPSIITWREKISETITSPSNMLSWLT